MSNINNSIPLWRRTRPTLYFPHLVGLNHLETCVWKNCATVHKLIHPSLQEAIVKYLFQIIIHSSSTSEENDEQYKNLHPKMFPGAHPVSLNKDDAHEIFWKQEHMFALKKDGERMLMFGIHLVSNTDYIVQTLTGFMTRKNNEIFFVPPNTIGTKEHLVPFVVDGELCWNKSTLELNYVVFELMLCNGLSLNHFGLFHREEVYQKMIEVGIVNSENYKLKISGEHHYFLFQYEGLIERRYKTQHIYDYDGLIATHFGKRCILGNDENTFKIKDIHTLDFRMKRHPVKQQFVELWVIQSFKKEIKYTEQNIIATGLDIDRSYDWDNKIYECEFDPRVNIFVIKKQRPDKDHANSIQTVEKTMYTIAHNLFVDDVYDLFKEWKLEQDFKEENGTKEDNKINQQYSAPFVPSSMILQDSNWRSENLTNEALIAEMKSPLLSWEVEENAQREKVRRELYEIESAQQKEYLKEVTTIPIFTKQLQSFISDYLQHGDNALF
jgi:mRNA capping enzyme, catalytic domain/mRNA capping enzyme, C-terminal domain